MRALFCICLLVLGACSNKSGHLNVSSAQIQEQLATQKLEKTAAEKLAAEKMSAEKIAAQKLGVNAPPKKRLFRLSQTQFDLTVKELFPGVVFRSISEFIPLDPKQTNYEFSDNLILGGSNFTPYQQWIEHIVSELIKSPIAAIDCPASNALTACQEKSVDLLVKNAFRNTLVDKQYAQYNTLYKSMLTSSGDSKIAMSQLLRAIFNAPQFVYRLELTTGSDNKLTSGELRQALAFTLTDAPMVKETDPSVAAESVVAKLMSSTFFRDKLKRFFIAWLEIKEDAIFKASKEQFPFFTDTVAKLAVQETNQYLDHFLNQDSPNLKEIVTSQMSFAPDGMSAVYGTGTLSADKRMGIFTQSAFIASHSGPIEPGLVKRGIFFTRKIMCLDPGPLPAGVNTVLRVLANQTERERIESATKNAPCSNCHRVINPFGFAFENFDSTGRWRAIELGKPVNSQVSMQFLGDANTVTNTPIDAINYFVATDKFRQCFAKQLFKFYMGRENEPADDDILNALTAHLKNSGDEIKGLLTTLVNSSQFSTRVERSAAK